MKKMNKFIMTVILSLSGVTVYAYDFEVEGIYYNITSDTDFKCEVTHKNIPSDYYGDIVIPSTVEYNGNEYSVIAIEAQAFDRSYGLTSITIPNSVIFIGNHAFSECSNLKSVNIPSSVTDISYAYSGCTNLESVNIPNSVTDISNKTFYHCDSLKFITIPNSVTSIGISAFYGCI